MRRRAGFWLGIVAAGAVAIGAAGFLAVRRVGAAAGFARVELVDQDGAPRRLDDWAGQVLVVDFVFTGCGDVCPLKTQQLAAVERGLAPALRRRVHFVSVSIDPEHDDPAAMRRYAERSGADLDDWSFLTGRLGAVARVAAAFDVSHVQPGTSAEPPSHVTTVQLLDPSGRVVETLGAEPLDEAGLTRLITALLQRTFTVQ